jgi:hypothetical protein
MKIFIWTDEKDLLSSTCSHVGSFIRQSMFHLVMVPSIHPGFKPMKKIHFIYKVRTNEKTGPFSSITVGNQWRKWFYFHHGANDNDQFHPTNVWTDENDLFFIHIWLCRITFGFHSHMLVHVSSNYGFFSLIFPSIHFSIHSFIHPLTPHSRPHP